jgi:hypothetical protein
MGISETHFRASPGEFFKFLSIPSVTNRNRDLLSMQYTICSGIIIFATLIPIGAIALNPKVVGGVPLEGEPRPATRLATSELKLEKPRSDGNLKPENTRSFGNLKHERPRNYDTDSSSDVGSNQGDNKTNWGFAI